VSRHAHCPRALASLAKLFAAVALFLIPFGSAFAQTQSYPYRPGEVLIKFLPGTSAAEQSAILGDLGATRLANLRQIGATQERISRLSVDEAIARYRGDRRVQYIEPNYVVHAFVTPNDPLFGQLWGMHNTGQTGGVVGADIHATQAWDVSTGSSNVLVAIIDTGVDYTHPDLAGNIFTNTAEIPGNGIDDDGNGFVDDVHGWDFVNHDNDPMDDFGHGTHVSGTVAAIGNNALGVVGVSWSAKILPLKFLDASGSGSTADAISAIQYATMMGVRIMSNSWGGGGYSQALHDAIQAAGDAGIVFVAAAGNSSSNNDVSPAYPASYDLPNIVSVAASDPNDNLAYFSNFGATTVDLAAPGTDILSTFPGGGYQYESGTSMATPHVSGALALIMGHFPMIDGLSAKNLLLANVDPESAFAGKTLTGGRLNAFKPLLVADSIPPAPITDVSVMQTGGDWVNLQWTATGDDGAIGRAVRYDMRYSTAPINAANFAAATAAGGAPDPQAAGATEHVRVNGLGFSTFYYFAVKAFDELGNPSPMSNVVSTTTLGAPVVGASPESLSADLLTGGKVTRTLTISNSGASELRFDIGQEAPAAPLTLPASVMAAIGKSTLRAPRLGGGTLASGARYEAGHSPTRLPVANPVRPPLNAAAGIGLNVLLLESGADVSQMHDLLAAFPDIAKVDIFDATSAVPTADLLRGYNSVIAVDATAFGDPVGVGNALADYVDGGGGLVMTLASFINGWAINGRLLTGGYIPFELGWLLDARHLRCVASDHEGRHHDQRGRAR
jgi:Subtilase family